MKGIQLVSSLLMIAGGLNGWLMGDFQFERVATLYQ